ncbi:hypothetical protein DL95DRAFT_491699 [Leptodontidium sp. 2 PMI_412]|nr:hypothetical protein DL95DRAFT_491699 [Leptodontidium sp. 2 PMI_412]
MDDFKSDILLPKLRRAYDAIHFVLSASQKANLQLFKENRHNGDFPPVNIARLCFGKKPCKAVGSLEPTDIVQERCSSLVTTGDSASHLWICSTWSSLTDAESITPPIYALPKWGTSEAVDKLKKMLWGLEALRVFDDRLSASLSQIQKAQEAMERTVKQIFVAASVVELVVVISSVLNSHSRRCFSAVVGEAEVKRVCDWVVGRRDEGVPPWVLER